jgi:hypothetical protein
MRVEVILNATGINPYARWGLRCNPFPAIATYGYAAANALLADLAARPIASQTDLRDRLKGCSAQFLELCVRYYRPGKRTRFYVEWTD